MSSLVRMYYSNWYHICYQFISWNRNAHEPRVWLVRRKHSLMYWTTVNPCLGLQSFSPTVPPQSMQDLCSLGMPHRADTDWLDSSEHRRCRTGNKGWWLTPGVFTGACLFWGDGAGETGPVLPANYVVHGQIWTFFQNRRNHLSCLSKYDKCIQPVKN